MLRIAIDMDDVMANTHEKVVDTILNEFTVPHSREELLTTNLRTILDPKQLIHLGGILHSPGFFRDIPVMKDAQSVIEELSNEYEIFVASAAMEYRNSLIDKCDWLDEHFSFIPWKNRVLCGDKCVINADILIDDQSKNFVGFVGKGILYNSPNNGAENEYKRVMNWQEVSEFFMKDFHLVEQ